MVTLPTMGIPLTAQFRQQRSRLILGACVTALAVQLGFFTFAPRTGILLVQRCGYALMLATFVWWVVLLGKMIPWRDLGEQARRGGWRIIVLVAVLSGVLHMQERHGFKVVNDELLQASTVQRMHFTREAHAVGRGYELGTNFVLMQGSVDKRPLLFPFLVSLLHDVSGYRPGNAFVLNGLLTTALLGLLYLVGSWLRGRGAGIAAMVMFATVPLLTQVATGGGFELLNLVMILATLYLGMIYAARPTGITLGAFCLAGILLAQVRYESVLFVLPVALVILWRTGASRTLLLPWPLLLAPLLLVLYPLQYHIFDLQPGLWQLGDRPSDHGVYSLAYFYDNVGRALSYFFEWDRSQPNSHLLALAGIVGLGFFWMWFYREYRQLRTDPGRSVFVVFVLALCLQAALMLCYFWGAYDDVLTVRLSLPTQLLFVLAFVFVYPELVGGRWRWHALIVLTAFYFSLWTMPTLARRAYAHENVAAETSNWYREFLEARSDAPDLVVEPKMPLLWVAYEVSGVDYFSLAERAENFLYHQRRATFGEILVVQRMAVVDFATSRWAPIPEHDFGAAVELEMEQQIQFTPTYAMRISRILSVDTDAFLAWAERKKNSIAPQSESSETLQTSQAVTDSGRSRREAEYTAEWLKNLP